MMGNSKTELYDYVEQIRIACGICLSDYPICVQDVANTIDDIHICYEELTTPGLNGLLVPTSSDSEQYAMLLRRRKHKVDCEFPCAHELIHFFKHRDHAVVYQDYSGLLRPEQNSYLEWEANEGAAELKMPYRLFIPAYSEILTYIKKTQNFDVLSNIDQIISGDFNVPEQIVYTRAKNLLFELHQFMNGTPLDEIIVMPTRQQRREGIFFHENIFELLG